MTTMAAMRLRLRLLLLLLLEALLLLEIFEARRQAFWIWIPGFKHAINCASHGLTDSLSFHASPINHVLLVGEPGKGIHLPKVCEFLFAAQGLCVQ